MAGKKKKSKSKSKSKSKEDEPSTKKPSGTFDLPSEAIPAYIPPPPVTGHQLTTQEIRDLKVVFDAFDLDSSGTIDLKELRRAMKILGFRVTRREVKEMMANVDVHKKGCLSFNDFLAFVVERQSDSRDIFEEIRQGFNVFDLDKDGKVTLSSLKRLCRENGIRMSDRELRDMIREADHNGDDAVDEDEFIGIMLKTNLF